MEVDCYLSFTEDEDEAQRTPSQAGTLMRPQWTLRTLCHVTLAFTSTLQRCHLEHLHVWQTRSTRELKEQPSTNDNRVGHKNLASSFSVETAPQHAPHQLLRVPSRIGLQVSTVVTGLITALYWLSFSPYLTFPSPWMFPGIISPKHSASTSMSQAPLKQNSSYDKSLQLCCSNFWPCSGSNNSSSWGEQ